MGANFILPFVAFFEGPFFMVSLSGMATILESTNGSKVDAFGLGVGGGRVPRKTMEGEAATETFLRPKGFRLGVSAFCGPAFILTTN